MSGRLDTSLGMIPSIGHAELEALAHEPGTTILEFTAAWCPPCKALAPILASVAAERAVRLVAIDVDEEQALAERFAIRAMPTVVVWRDGQEVERFLGLRSRAFVDEVVTRGLR